MSYKINKKQTNMKELQNIDKNIIILCVKIKANTQDLKKKRKMRIKKNVFELPFMNLYI